MLYKKTHRQYLREFKVGRRYRYEGDGVYEITRKPYIDEDYYIKIDVDNDRYFSCRCIAVIALYSGKMWYKFKIAKDIIIWLD